MQICYLPNNEPPLPSHRRLVPFLPVNLILLLCTASYRFDKLIEMAQAVREVIPADMPLLVNADDLTAERRLEAVKFEATLGC